MERLGIEQRERFFGRMKRRANKSAGLARVSLWRQRFALVQKISVFGA